ncbi:hypothetical protein [Methanosarcina barkeri]|uniref:ATP-grasp protein n=1 Tax=Methanosarcina barkeri CM1 TaxID=796385 RepID=A0A0G3CIE1_METBA|nr:hypothetical protein [Methanosarcina barkeri]AKJ38887.1 ATP-grasp protein [Methanosarcina barkeri CM1]
MMKRALLFSGYNQRSVIALCRYFSKIGIEILIVSSGKNDSIYQTVYNKNVIFERLDSRLNIQIFEKVASYYTGPIIYCPTSEYLNRFVLENYDELIKLDIEPGMPLEEIYTKVTNKRSSQDIVKYVSGVKIPKEMPVSEAKIPCVLKPYTNIADCKVLYPIICQDDSVLRDALSNIKPEYYFAQEFIEGQSYYLCGVLAKNGEFCCYWQENLLQQGNGKSMVLARSCKNPGLNENLFFNAIHSSGYYGIMMTEFIKRKDELYYIETNPRFWGPFQLAIDHCSRIMDFYMKEWFGVCTHGCNREATDYYAWYYGAKQSGLKKYPSINNINNVDFLLEKYDVYNRGDTVDLHKRY